MILLGKKAAKSVYFNLLGTTHIFASSYENDSCQFGQFEQQRKKEMKEVYIKLCNWDTHNQPDIGWWRIALYNELCAKISVTNQALDNSETNADDLFGSDDARAASKTFCTFTVAEDSDASVNVIIPLDVAMTDVINLFEIAFEFYSNNQNHFWKASLNNSSSFAAIYHSIQPKLKKLVQNPRKVQEKFKRFFILPM